MPPLGRERNEAVAEHRRTENHAVAELLGRDAASHRTLTVIPRILARLRIATEVRMALRPEPVEGAAHVEFLLRSHIEECQVEGAATGVAAFLANVFAKSNQLYTFVIGYGKAP